MANQFENPMLGRAGYGATTVDRATYDVGLRAHMLRVYNYMASGLVLSGIVALLVANNVAGLGDLFWTTRMSANGRAVITSINMLGWVAIFAPLGMLLLAMFALRNMSVRGAQAFYWTFVALMGVSLSLVLYRYTGASVTRVFFITAAAFGALSLYGYTTKRDLSGWGKFLFMGVIGLIIAGIVNMFMQSSMLHFIFSAAGVLIFSALIAYDTQRIKEQYSAAMGTDQQEHVAIFGALSLYLDFVNLFQFLMSFLGDRE
jgi:FtsH-binding integral membrane protein